jgi:hypothetical protein
MVELNKKTLISRSKTEQSRTDWDWNNGNKNREKGAILSQFPGHASYLHPIAVSCMFDHHVTVTLGCYNFLHSQYSQG